VRALEVLIAAATDDAGSRSAVSASKHALGVVDLTIPVTADGYFQHESLSASDIARMRRWIAAGAPDN
jgi:hypothetical protein